MAESKLARMFRAAEELGCLACPVCGEALGRRENGFACASYALISRLTPSPSGLGSTIIRTDDPFTNSGPIKTSLPGTVSDSNTMAGFSSHCGTCFH